MGGNLDADFGAVEHDTIAGVELEAVAEVVGRAVEDVALRLAGAEHGLVWVEALAARRAGRYQRPARRSVMDE